MGDLFVGLFPSRKENKRGTTPHLCPGNAEVERFFAAAKKFDDYLASTEPLHASEEAIFQSGLADALTHVGQIAMLRRLGGSPILGENYFKADIAVGRVGPDNSLPVANSNEVQFPRWFFAISALQYELSASCIRRNRSGFNSFFIIGLQNWLQESAVFRYRRAVVRCERSLDGPLRRWGHEFQPSHKHAHRLHGRRLN